MQLEYDNSADELGNVLQNTTFGGAKLLKSAAPSAAP
jgi:hypothetical protein